VTMIGDKDLEGTRRVMLHCVYLSAHKAFVATEYKKYASTPCG
jgi:hypothetical protein